MVCEVISTIETLSDFMVWPTTCDFYFYLKILGAIMIVLAWTIYKVEQLREGKGDFMSSLAVSSLAITIIASIGTLVQSTDGIPLIQLEILLIFIAIAIPLNLIWFFRD